MRKILVIWMVMIAAACSAYEIRNIDGNFHNTARNNVMILFASLNCAPINRMVEEKISGIAKDYPDAKVMVLFPCVESIRTELITWRSQVIGASNTIVCESPLREMVNQLWADVGYARPALFLFDKSGVCQTNWTRYNWSRTSIEAPLARQLLNLTIVRGTNLPPVGIKSVDVGGEMSVQFRNTYIPWRVITNSGVVTTYQLVYP